MVCGDRCGLPNFAISLQLLIPHMRYTLHINTLARQLLIAPGKVVDKVGAAFGGVGTLQVEEDGGGGGHGPCYPSASAAPAFEARTSLPQSTGLGIGGFSDLIKRNMEQLNYSVLCLPEDIRARDVEDIPGYYYRDDGMQIWGAIKR